MRRVTSGPLDIQVHLQVLDHLEGAEDVAMLEEPLEESGTNRGRSRRQFLSIGCVHEGGGTSGRNTPARSSWPVRRIGPETYCEDMSDAFSPAWPRNVPAFGAWLASRRPDREGVTCTRRVGRDFIRAWLLASSQ
jgi:hypothetical protein